VFYNNEDLLKFYHYNKLEKDIIYFKNYIQHPKENGYKALHFHYRIPNEKIDKLECQLYILEDFYDSLYGNSSNYK
jgi:ppGpp synthetase/RelA/SpoT-type nucleotidyltranferase